MQMLPLAAPLKVTSTFWIPLCPSLDVPVMVTGPPNGEAAPPIVPVSRDQPLRLSFAQERLWLLDQLEPGTATYNLPGALRLTGKLERAALEWTIAEILRRHESLRTTFGTVDGVPVQVVHPARAFELQVVAVDGEAQAEEYAAREAALPFDLAKGPLVRPAFGTASRPVQLSSPLTAT